ncbi:hypothetical protein NMY22_g16060 [Coprinellus aureogranulatus]|nr:hypothetical protein NMY22_g16060 [Coprinellus aureogranulatus]
MDSEGWVKSGLSAVAVQFNDRVRVPVRLASRRHLPASLVTALPLIILMAMDLAWRGNASRMNGSRLRQILIRRAESILNTEPNQLRKSWHDELVQGLSEDEDFDIVGRVMAALDVAANIPAGPFNLQDHAATRILNEAQEAAQKVLMIVTAFQETKQFETLEQCSRRFFSVLADNWEGAIRCLTLLVRYCSLSTTPSVVVCRQAHLLCLIAGGMESDSCKEDILCRPSTADFMYLLLNLVDPQTRRHYVAQPSGESGICAILHLFQTSLLTPELGTALRCRLLSYGKAKRGVVLESLIRRAEELSSSSSNLVGASTNLVFVITVFCMLVVDIDLAQHHQNAFFRLASALCTFCEKAHKQRLVDDNFWQLVVDGIGTLVRGAVTPIGRAGVLQLVQGGILVCVARTSSRITSMNAQFQLLTLVPYLYPYKVLQVAGSRHDLKFWADALPDNTPSIQKDLHNAYRAALLQSLASKRGSNAIPLCSNLKHPKKYNGSKSLNSWPSLGRRSDALSIVTTFINSACQSPAQLKRIRHAVVDFGQLGTFGPPLLRFKPGCSLVLVDYYALRNDRPLMYEQVDVESYFHPIGCVREYMEPSLPRLQRFIDDVEANEKTMILVAGRFRINVSRVLVAFALMRYSANADVHQRYSVVYSTFWTGDLNSLKTTDVTHPF